MTTTIHDVARHAKVGIGTVSRVLNNSAQVAPDTRERVQTAIRELGFKPNRAARQLPRGTRHRTIGVLLPFFTDQPFVERLRGVQIALREAVGRPTTGATDADSQIHLVLYSVDKPHQLDAQLGFIIQHGQIDGLLVLALNLDTEQIDLLYQGNIPVVRVYDRPLENSSTPAVCLDNHRGGYMATDHLIQRGHRRIAYIGDRFPDPYHFPTSEQRYTGYRDALYDHGLPLRADYVRFDVHTQDAARQAALELLALPEPPTGIFAMSDMQAIAAVTAIRESGKRVPEDVSIIGFDDIEVSRYIGLTTIRQHFEDSGRMATEMLLRHMETLQSATVDDLPEVYLSPLKLIERSTTARLAQT